MRSFGLPGPPVPAQAFTARRPSARLHARPAVTPARQADAVARKPAQLCSNTIGRHSESLPLRCARV